MDKQTAISIIEETLNKKFNEKKFTQFIHNILNDIEPKDNHYSGAMLWDAYKEHIHAYKRIGKYTDSNDEALDILLVEVKDVAKLDRTRTALRNFTIKHLEKFEKDYALVAFYSKQDDGREWRFSFVKLEHHAYMDEEKQKVKTKKEFTPAKRYSFLVGEDEDAYTAKMQLLPLLQNVYSNPTIEEIESAFSIEKVTDEFFEQYKSLYVKLYEHLEKDDTLQRELSQEGVDTSRFTKKLLGQIVFLYFLQKKGWLGVEKEEKWGEGNKQFMQYLYEKAQAEEENFFGEYLQFLFYEALAKKHSDEGVASYCKHLGYKIPFLNGGLFEADYDWKHADITIPNELFRNNERTKDGDKGTGVLDIFDRYNFTIKEDEPLEKEIAVDPEMLGKVFENMLEVKERRSKGAFYTPREIVHYMCQESLIQYLDNTLINYTSTYQELNNNQSQFFGNEVKTGQGTLMIKHKHKHTLVPKKDIENFIRNGHFALENDQRVTNKGKETKAYRFQLPEKIRNHADNIDKALTSIKILDPAIGSGAFPVGLLHELVNAQLVLKPHLSKKYLEEKNKIIGFIAKASDNNDNRYVYRIKRHTIQESIYGVDIDASAIDIARLRLWLSLVVDEDDLDPIETLPNLDYKIVQGNSIQNIEENVFNSHLKNDLEKKKKEFFNTTDRGKKIQLQEEIHKLFMELTDGKNEFDIKLYFSEVWHEKDGFDVLIGNPPYNELRDLTVNEKKIYEKSKYYKHAKGGRVNLFQFFYPLGIDLVGKPGIVTLITQNSILAEDSAIKNRGLIFDKCKILKIDSFPERDDINKRVFKSAKMSVAILFLLKTNMLDELDNFKITVFKNKFMTDYHKLFINKKMIRSLYPEKLILPIASEKAFNVLLKINAIKNKILLSATSGEIDMTKYKNKFADLGDLRVVTGAQVLKYKLTNNPSQGKVLYLNLSDLLISNKKRNDLTNKRIVMQRITGVDSKIRIISTLIKKNILCANSTNYISQNTMNQSLKYILAILNSSLINFYFKQTSTNTNVTTAEINNLPIATTDISTTNILDILVEYILFLKQKNIEFETNFFEQLIDAMVFELYFSDEIKLSNKEIAKYVDDLKPIIDKMNDEEKLAIIKSEFGRLYDPIHPVRNNLETLDSIEEIRIIKEAVK